MNKFFQENFFTIIILFLFCALVLMGLIGAVIIKLLLNSKRNSASQIPMSTLPSHPQEFQKPFNHLANEEVQEKFYCANHLDAPSAGACLICEEVFCEKCLIEESGLSFCKEHFKTFANNKWRQITDVKTTPENPHDGLYIYHFKRHIWKERKIPSFVLTHYKINLEHDYIESYIQLNILENQSNALAEELDSFSQN